jgi:hypothetical protein
VRHRDLASGRWFELTLTEQLGNIGSEVSRAARWQGKDERSFMGAVERALELFDLTLGDARWKHRRKEICRSREVFCDAVLGTNTYHTSLDELNTYFTRFALAARNGAGK